MTFIGFFFFHFLWVMDFAILRYVIWHDFSKSNAIWCNWKTYILGYCFQFAANEIMINISSHDESKQHMATS